MPNCKKCGVKIGPGDNNCIYCGAPVTPVENRQQISPENIQDVRPVAFKKVSILAMALLFIASLGLYLVIWYFIRREEIKKIVRDDAKLNTLIITYVFIVIMNFLLPGMEYLIILLYFGLTAHFACVIRVALKKYVYDSGNVQTFAHVMPSMLLTAIFQIFYLQIHINSLIESRVFYEQ